MIPLAERMRPKNLDDYVGQSHLVGADGIIRQQILADNIPSIIFWGPPGTGKTTLAQIIANESKRKFFQLSAINSGVKEVREMLDNVKKNNTNLFSRKNPIVFIDEIHRFNKAQQDSLLQAVETGLITLIGATTENPSFEVIPALMSRCQVYVLNLFTKDELARLALNAIEKDAELQKKKITLKETTALVRLSGGDARKLLNTLEIAVNSYDGEEITITDEVITRASQQKTVLYDKAGEQHYDIISAFIKSIRGSDPNAAVYWLARMIEGGEDIKFIARRMIISASEDIGNANPTAMIIANNTFQAINVVGLPEARIILSQCATYLACSPKSNAAYMAINAAIKKVKETGNLQVPIHLRNAPTKLMKELGYGEDYKYSHDYEDNFVVQEFMPPELSNETFYRPGDNLKEARQRKELKEKWGSKYDY